MLIALGAEETAAAGRAAEDIFVRQMKRLRAARGLTQAELADRVANLGGTLYQQTIAKIEAGQRAVRLQEADQIAQALGGTVAEMLSGAIGDAEESSEEIEIEDLFSQLQAALRRRAEAREQAHAATEREENARHELQKAEARATAAIRESQRAAMALSETEAMVSHLSRASLERQSELNAKYGPRWRRYIDPRAPITVGMLQQDNLEHLDKLRELAESSTHMNSRDRAQLMQTIEDLERRLGLGSGDE